MGNTELVDIDRELEAFNIALAAVEDNSWLFGDVTTIEFERFLTALLARPGMCTTGLAGNEAGAQRSNRWREVCGQAG